MEVGKNFNDQKSYNASMGRAIDDKLFFLDKMNLSDCIFIDFGCADGTVLQELEKRTGSNKNLRAYLGYDISKSMIELAKEKWDGQTQDVYFSNTWQYITERAKWIKENRSASAGKIKTVLILSSVIHELYSYCDQSEIAKTWNKVFDLKPDYIVFRDMMWSDTDTGFDVKGFVQRIRNSRSFLTPGRECLDLLSSFEKEWGTIDKAKNLTHFLLKYRWRVNWDREVEENYFPITLTQFLNKIETKYEPEYLERVSIPYIQSCIKRDFEFDFPIKTHLKAIFRLKN